MQLILQEIEPSSFQNPYISANNRHLFALSKLNNLVTIGRLQFGKKSESNMHLDVKHQSISRKHARVNVSPFSFNDEDQDVPAWYLKLKGMWQELPFYTLQNIRQYCKPKQVLLVVDMDSKYGLFKQVKSVAINNEQAITNKKYLQSRHEIYLKKNQPVSIQIGNESVTIDQICWNLSKKQVISYQESVSKTIKHLKVVLKPINALQQFPSQFSTLLLTHEEQSETGMKSRCFLLICAQSPHLFGTLSESDRRFSLGRHPCCDVQINKGSISRKQAYIFMESSNHWVVQDAQSMNGLWIKCKKIEYPIHELVNKSVHESKLSKIKVLDQIHSINSEDNNQSEEEKQQQSQITKIASIKLGEVKFNIQLFKIQNLDEKLGERSNEYQPILTEISGFQLN